MSKCLCVTCLFVCVCMLCVCSRICAFQSSLNFSKFAANSRAQSRHTQTHIRFLCDSFRLRVYISCHIQPTNNWQKPKKKNNKTFNTLFCKQTKMFNVNVITVLMYLSAGVTNRNWLESNRDNNNKNSHKMSCWTVQKSESEWKISVFFLVLRAADVPVDRYHKPIIAIWFHYIFVCPSSSLSCERPAVRARVAFIFRKWIYLKMS